MTKFKSVQKQHFPTLDIYVPVVARVHGGSHPEFHKVKELYEQIKTKVAEAESLAQEFAELRQVTDDYTVPGDVCESYEAVYKMLEELDQAYHA